MLGPTYLAFIRYFYCACLTRPPDFLSRFRNLAGATQRIEVHPEIESHVTLPNLIVISLQMAELQDMGGFSLPPPGLTDFKKPGLNRVKGDAWFG